MSSFGTPISFGKFAAPDFFTGNGSTTSFTLTYTPGSKWAIEVYVNGVRQFNSYSVTGKTLTFDQAPDGQVVVCYVGIEQQVGTPADGTVGKIQTNDEILLADGTRELTGKLTGSGRLDPALLKGRTNWLINSDFSINQRGASGTSVTSGSFFRDRWKGWTAGATVSFSGKTITLTGEIAQIIETPGFDTQVINVSVLSPSASITVYAIAHGSGSGSVSGTISAGTGRRSVSLTVPATATGNIVVILVGSGVSFSLPVVTLGPDPVDYAQVARPIGEELALCQRYYWKGDGYFYGANYAASDGMVNIGLPVSMRAVPTVSASATSHAVKGTFVHVDRISWFLDTGGASCTVQNPAADAEL